jgi:L-2-hydroxyglutarate oxidase LhgO
LVQTADYVIIGAGVVGLSIARELKSRYRKASIVVLEKEQTPGQHSSGRNSGVLHSGIYYPPDSLKARVCRSGAVEMAEYHVEHRLPLNRIGKVLVATRPEDASQLDLLLDRARLNGIKAERLDLQSLKALEPEAYSATQTAIWVPGTSVGSPAQVMSTLADEATSSGVQLVCGVRPASVEPERRILRIAGGRPISYGHAINASGLYADSVAHLFGVGKRYSLLPFKGLYWKLDPRSGIKPRHLIYPVPDLRVPFLGVHTTTTVDGDTYLGPTAVPAFGRENYRGLAGITPGELARISLQLAIQYVKGEQGFRRLAWQEGRRYFKRWFTQAARTLLPRLRSEDLLPSEKAGIRAQMLDRKTGTLVTDFLVERGPSSTHILNAISPAWTSAFPLARHICDQFIEGNN